MKTQFLKEINILPKLRQKELAYEALINGNYIEFDGEIPWLIKESVKTLKNENFDVDFDQNLLSFLRLSSKKVKLFWGEIQKRALELSGQGALDLVLKFFYPLFNK